MKSGDVVIVALREGLTEGQSVAGEWVEEHRGVLLDRVAGAHVPLRNQDADSRRQASRKMISAVLAETVRSTVAGHLHLRSVSRNRRSGWSLGSYNRCTLIW